MSDFGMTETEARDEICRVGRSLFERGYVHATAGNISVQLHASEGGGFLITPTDACLGFLDPSQLARLGPDGVQLSGARASKTLVLHRRIYEASAATATPAHCILHTHSTHCVGLTLGGSTQATPHGRELLPAITPYFVMKVGRVPVIDYARPGAPEAASQVAETIVRYDAAGAPIRAVMLERLGPNVWHDSPATAMATLEELEESAKLWAHNSAMTAPLTDVQISELRASFGAHW